MKALLLVLLSAARALLAAPAPPTPAPMRVPAELLRRTSMPEASGLVWSAALRRYLVVSDDTGDKGGGTNHAPWLLAMGEDGALDPEVVPLLGIGRLNDGEALCPGPDGTFLLTTSHAPDKKGRDRAERRRLLHLSLDGRALRVRGALDLAAPLLASGLLPESARAVDIEALAFRDGLLYVGLKAPLGERGGALILRARGVLPALAAGRLGEDQLERLAEVPLRGAAPRAGGPPAAQGLSDMSFLPDGSLVLLGNSPKGLPPDGGGALYHLPLPAAPRAPGPPRLLRRFPGLKPEGVALSGDGKGLLIVFDRDRQEPLWLRLPLPGP